MKDLAKKSVDDLKKELAEKRQSLREVRFAFAGATSKNVKAAREIRKDIARILTELGTRTQ